MATAANDINRRRFLAALGMGAAALAALPLTGCATTSAGPGGTDGATAGSGGGSGSQGTAAGGDASAAQFSFASYMASEKANQPFFTDLVDGYQKSKSVKIELQAYPFADYNSPVLLSAKSGEIHGAAQVSIADVSTYAAAGVVMDLSQVAAKHDYTKAGLTGCTFDDKVFALPWAIDAIGLVCNKALLDKAGAKVPTTIVEFESTLLALKEIDGVVPYAAGTKADAIKDVVPWMWTYGAKLLEDGKVTVGDDASVEALIWWKSLLDRKLIALDVDRPGARVLYGRGTACFYDDAVQAKAFAAALDGVSTGLLDNTIPVARPVLKAGDDPRALLHGTGMMVFQGTASKTATEFAEFTTTDAGSLEKFLKVTGLPPATESGLAAPAVAKDSYQSKWADLITKTATPDPFWRYPQFAAIGKALADAVGSVLTGQAQPKAALTDAAAAMQKLVDA